MGNPIQNFPHLKKGDFKELIVPLPPHHVQNFIGKFYCNISRKIDVLEKINYGLEKIIQTIFRSWFVDFDGQKEFADSELGEIPKGWNVKKIGELGDVITGKTPPTKDMENFGSDYPFITIPDIHNSTYAIKPERYLSEIGKRKFENFLLPYESVCVSCIATPGLVSLTSRPSFTNQQINSIICNNEISPYYLYEKMIEIKEKIIQLGSGGTATPNLNKGDFSRIKVLIPPTPLLNNFHVLVKPLFNSIYQNSNYIIILREIRDSLLPKLMSGKIQV